ncbi:MAG: diguanylate cyclase domain-containing protein [Thermoleophilaceae bacterium]
MLAWTLGEIYYTAVLWTAETVPVPSPADAGYLLMPPLVLAGLVVLVRSRTSGVPVTLRADGLTAALAIAAVSAAIVFETVLRAAPGDLVGVATSLAYPLSDLILAGFVVGALAGTGWRLDRTWSLLGLGILTFWLADSRYLVHVANDTVVSPSWYDAGWWIGLTLIGAAAWQPVTTPDAEPPREGLRLIVMPLSFGVIGLTVLIYGCFAHLNALAVVLAAAALAAVMARLILTFREHVRMLHLSRAEALADALTGLPNRRALARHLERAIPRASDGQPLVLALFDLDGFKLYNDTFGHPAGDALLARLGSNLRRYLDGRGTAYRMGGDEFCALFEPRAQVIEPIVAGAASALSEQGEGFSIGCSQIAAAPALTEVASLVRSSHERWDGEGYPDRLAGAEIPLGSRILAVADSFDAMTADRPYSGPRTPDDALRELRDCAGSQFDPVVVEAFCAVWAARNALAAAGAGR